ncbi:GGDEF domain-containing protein [Shewanella avicenniae]|uniref:diguanylate cyclase n=1 Tax=Shewanella avicenniae TaxID=2814294 RepID=A0ABX7QNK0_9GAMM|nr:GGDEF domain-containing protein [Shewanella avicenniae]QSX32824.1 GGDEF domain-containing protein [Shewanella avicenniae]
MAYNRIDPALADDMDQYRRSLLRIMLAVMAAIALGLSLSNYSSGKELSFILAETAIGIYCLVFLMRLKQVKCIRCWMLPLIITVFSIVVVAIHQRALAADGFYWLMLMPPMSLLFTGLTFGGVLSGVFGLLGLAVLGNSMRLADQSLDVPLIVNGAMCYVIIWSTCHVCEYRRIMALKKLRNIAARDPLTGIYNRLQLEDAFSQLQLQHDQHGESFAMLLLDIDYFKRLNDQYGHIAGDQVLRQLALMLRQACLTQDWCFRMGGEEFCVLLPQCDASSAITHAENLRQKIANHAVPYLNHSLHFTVSIGIAVWPDDGNDFDAFYRQADERLYLAKHQGRNCTVGTGDTQIQETAS